MLLPSSARASWERWPRDCGGLHDANWSKLRMRRFCKRGEIHLS
jgi:hypothetical protein